MTGHTLLGMDFETRSAVDIVKCGSFRYIEDDSFEPLLLAYAFDDEPVKLVDFMQGETWPEDFLDGLRDPSVTKWASNAAFERKIIDKCLGYSDPSEWLDIMHVAAQCGLPLSLDSAGKALGLGEEQAKMKEGKALIRYFCLPRKPTKTNDRPWNDPEDAPEKWQTFRDYCIRDVEAERTIFRMLERWLPSNEERRFWALDARINERGVRIDRRLAENAVAMDERYKAELTERAVALTGLDNPKSVSQIKTWLFDQEGQEFPSLNKKVIADVVSSLQTDSAKEFMGLRGELSKSSTAKYAAMLRSVCSDEHVKGCFQFYGANRTGRFAGRLVQFQNMSKNYTEDLDGMRDLVRNGHYTALRAIYGGVSDPLSQLVRTAIIPEEGQKLLISDFSAIEARVTAWFAGEEWRLKTFREGGDIYCASASQMFHVPVVKHGVNGELRQKGKIAELALGYGGGVNALKAFGADKMGMSEEEMQETVDLWRESSPRICDLWRALEKAAIHTVVKRTPTVSAVGNVRFDFESGILWMTLPSGRRIAYYGAAYEPSARKPDRKCLSYMGVDQQTKRWSRVETWGGKLVENCWAAGTPVLAKRGWVPIETVTAEDEVFDGRIWVHCGGAKERRTNEPLYVLDGLTVTGDHRVLTTKGWVHAKDCEGLDRVQPRLSDAYASIRDTCEARSAEEVVRAVSVRTGNPDRPARPGKSETPRRETFLRLHEKRVGVEAEKDARHDKASGIRSLALNGSTLHRAYASCVAELRRAWDHRLRPLAAQLRELLGGHGSDVRARAGYRPDQQQRRVLARELSLDNPHRKLQEQARGADNKDVWTRRASESAGRELRDKLLDADLPARSRLSVEPSVRSTEHGTKVYDVLNCGTFHAYTVLGDTGPIIAHNCVQATARDLLREAMLNLDAHGFDIRAHVHDEVICTEPIGGRSVEEMNRLMCPATPWAEGLPLNADGYEGAYYFKD